MPSGYGLFDGLFGQDNLYLSLVTLETESSFEAVRTIITALSCEKLAEILKTMLAGHDWRDHIIPAVSIALDMSDEGVFNSAWQAIWRGSFFSPQLVAALSVSDPRFVFRARERMEYLRPRLLEWLQRKDELYPFEKTGDMTGLTAMILFVERCETENPSFAGRPSGTLDEEIISRLVEADTDCGFQIATTWLDRLENIVKQVLASS